MGIVHRDLKHLNILINVSASGKPLVKITDFGMAAKLNKGETITKIAGTIGFMAPEIIQKQPSDFKVDIWSIGVILYALISSTVPFQAQTRDETATLIINA